MPKCQICGKGPVAGRNVPRKGSLAQTQKTQHKTPRLIQPNIQKVGGLKMCTRCLRTVRNSFKLEKTA